MWKLKNITILLHLTKSIAKEEKIKYNKIKLFYRGDYESPLTRKMHTYNNIENTRRGEKQKWK